MKTKRCFEVVGGIALVMGATFLGGYAQEFGFRELLHLPMLMAGIILFGSGVAVFTHGLVYWDE